MTALAMIIGMLPMALALGEGGEQNAPLGRAVIGGLLLATVGTLFIVPVIYSLLKKHPPVDYDTEIDDRIPRPGTLRSEQPAMPAKPVKLTEPQEQPDLKCPSDPDQRPYDRLRTQLPELSNRDTVGIGEFADAADGR